MKQTWEFRRVLDVLLLSVSNLCIHQPVRGRTCCPAECDDDSVFQCGNNAAIVVLDPSNADDGFSRESGLAEVPVERWVLVVLSGGRVDTLGNHIRKQQLLGEGNVRFLVQPSLWALLALKWSLLLEGL